MEDFFNRIKEEYDGQKHPPLRYGSWDAMEQKLDGSTSSENRDLPSVLKKMWWLIPMVLLLLWNVGLQVQLAQGMNGAHTVYIDTIYKERIITVRDTIVQTRTSIVYSQTGQSGQYLGRERNGNSLSTFKEFTPYSSMNEADDEGVKQETLENDLTIGKNPIESMIGLTVNNSNDQWVTRELAGTGGTESSIRVMEDILTPHMSHFLDHESLTKEARKRNLMQTMMPSGLAVYGGYGTLQTVNKPLENQTSSEWTIGLQLETEQGYNLWLEWAIQSLHFKAHGMGDQFGIPEVTPPSDDFQFENADVPEDVRQYSAGLGYTFNRNRRLRYQVGLGVSAVEYRSTEILYDFIRTGTNEEWIFEVYSQSTPIMVDYISLRAGLRYGLTRNWDIGLTTIYRLALDSDPKSNDHQLGIRLSLLANIF